MEREPSVQSLADQVVETKVNTDFAKAVQTLEKVFRPELKSTLNKKKEAISEINSWCDFLDEEGLWPRFGVDDKGDLVQFLIK